MWRILLAGAVAGVALTAVFNVSMEHTSTDEFCTGCHSMAAYAQQELMGSSHYSNRIGLRVSCADCHEPQALLPLVARKVEAAREVYAHLTGKLDSPAAYEQHRAAMAEREWQRLRDSDSEPCRRCHNPAAMTQSRALHDAVLTPGKTCIDCHRGVAHQLPAPT